MLDLPTRGDRLKFGALPEVGLAAARRECEDARRTLADGTAPGAARAEAKELQRLQLGTTFESVTRAWLQHWKAPRTARHTEYVMRRLEADVFPAIGATPICKVTAPPTKSFLIRNEAKPGSLGELPSP